LRDDAGRGTALNMIYFVQEVSYDSSRGGVSVITEKSDITTSYLLIQRAKSKDSGTYTCNPSNAKTTNITVHILNGEKTFNFNVFFMI
jgi:hypothetical protein